MTGTIRIDLAKRDDDGPAIPIELLELDGHPELSFLLVQPSDRDCQGVLSSWSWLGLSGMTLRAVGAFADLFLQDSAGRIIMLDALEGRLKPIFESAEAFAEALKLEPMRDEYLLAGLVIGARSRGLTLGEGECYDFETPPVLGGPIAPERVTKISLPVKSRMAAEIHRQIQSLPEGSRIEKIEIEGA